jgi:hypothetical protein
MNAHNLAPVAPIRPERDKQQKLICYRCNEWHPIAESWADFAGPAFRAFYCAPCAAEIHKTDA